MDAKTGHIDSFRFLRNTIDAARLADTVVPIVSSSAVAARMWRTPLNLVFIDGGHALETVDTDYCLLVTAYYPGRISAHP